MKKLVITIFVVLVISAAVVCGALVIKNLSPQIITEDETLNQTVAKIKEPAVIALPEFAKPDSEITLLAVGDIMLSRSVEQLMIKQNDFTLPFKPLAKITSAADIAFGNLETAILSGRPILTDEFNFRTDPKVIAGLKLGGFDLVSLANNHAPNFGQAGLLSTFQELGKNQINYVGAGRNLATAQRPVILERQGIKLGFLAYVYPGLPASYQATENAAGINSMDLAQLKIDIANLKNRVDFVIVSMHAGTEYAAKPNQEQIDFAHAAIDAGASLIIGHHPHVVQTFEKYQNGYIIYSLGNFVFDQLWSGETQMGMMAKITFLPKAIKNLEFIPVKINKNFQPEITSELLAGQITKRLAVDLSTQPRFFWDGKNYSETKSWQLNQLLPLQNQAYQAADLDGDGKPEEAVVVNGIGYLIKDNLALWQTDPAWRVENVLIGDFNNDGIKEVGFSLWKQGSYGSDLPAWEKENDKEISNHLFLYQFKDNTLKMVWGSSALDYPIKEMALVDLDLDGKNELAVLQATNSEGAIRESRLQNLGIWRFYEFNFVNLFTSRPGQSFDLWADANFIYLREK
ncbi:MAG: CapA family protein [Candidatus Buchananbacteria bacterium]